MWGKAFSAKLSRNSASPCLNSLKASVSVMATSSGFSGGVRLWRLGTPLRHALHVLNFHHLKIRQKIRRHLHGHTTEEPNDSCLFEKRCEKVSHCRHAER